MVMEWIKRNKSAVAIAVVAGVVAGFLFLPGRARAEGVAAKGSPIGLPTINSGTWTGCGVGIGASFLDGEISGFGGPINVGSDGQMLDGRFLCDLQVGSFVIGGNVDYGKVFGDLETIGADTAWAVGGRVGPLVNANTLLFVSGGWSRLDTSAGALDGWYLGGGIETKLPNSPLYLVLEYQHRTYDLTDIGGPSGLDASVDVIRAGVNIKLHFWK